MGFPLIPVITNLVLPAVGSIAKSLSNDSCDCGDSNQALSKSTVEQSIAKKFNISNMTTSNFRKMVDELDKSGLINHAEINSLKLIGNYAAELDLKLGTKQHDFTSLGQDLLSLIKSKGSELNIKNFETAPDFLNGLKALRNTTTNVYI